MLELIRRFRAGALAKSMSCAAARHELVNVDAPRGVLLAVGTSGWRDMEALHLATVLSLRENPEASGCLGGCDACILRVADCHSHRQTVIRF